MTRFHADEYVNFLKTVAPERLLEMQPLLARFNAGEDCPVFDGLWDFCQLSAGGSLAGAEVLNSGDADIAINWAGGLHHAKRAEASGFCYINDCVLAILELLKIHARVLYIDIDIHHGDGVEEAFYTTDRVMTVSFHKFGDYFPGTGDIGDVGYGRGKNYSVNFPLNEGITDEAYREIFVPVMSKVMEKFRPGAVVMQCGADSLSGDRLGCFNLSIDGHADCVQFMLSFGVPVLLIGGGGYTIRNVARCWAFETARALGTEINPDIPYNDYYEFYGPDFRLHITPSNIEDHNSREHLENMRNRILKHLSELPAAPSVPLHDAPISRPQKEDVDSDNDDPNVRKPMRLMDALRVRSNEFEDSDIEDGDAKPIPGARRKSSTQSAVVLPPMPRSRPTPPQKHISSMPPNRTTSGPQSNTAVLNTNHNRTTPNSSPRLPKVSTVKMEVDKVKADPDVVKLAPGLPKTGPRPPDDVPEPMSIDSSGVGKERKDSVDIDKKDKPSGL
eukprot:CAMPEP_0184681042 /NCGR_PEP_ID=MMETSP0312-20130426/3995_1 /TAXON_ID=31354 /ORGANISM="Compsopogon coeruleus, Strain SAG 36.94" /LENGTH=501 /DNA_ID=CAMNT_0027131609 /DNA_START=164 /DNA_END=1669 /DNA_ORIENTATION=-